MADYYPLLTKTFEGLSDTGPEMREAVYDRARRALVGQLRQLNPPLSEAEIEREGAALDRAILRIEERYAEPAAGPPVPTAEAAPSPPGPPPASPESSVSAAPSGETRAPASVTIRKGGRRPSLALPIGFVLLAIPVGAVAWFWRDRPAATPSAPAPVSVAPAPPADTKFAERVGSGSRGAPTPPAAAPAPSAVPPTNAPVASSPPASPPAAAPTPAPAAPPGPELAVSQRAILFEENPGFPQQPTSTPGRAIWRLDALNGGQGLPLETVIQGRVEIPNSGLSLTLLVRRNLDPALPASHTLELSFTTQAGDPGRIVRDVGVPSLRPDESGRGVTLAGLPVPVKENVFLIGLSDVRSDVDKNTDLLTNRSWIEMPLRFASGQKALLLFDKGVSGDRIFADAFKQWRSGP